VTFKVKAATEYGQNIGVIGNLSELGEWRKETDEPIYIPYNPESAPHFYYKYVLLDSNLKFIKYEEGIDRLADLTLLNDDPFKQDSALNSREENGPSTSGKVVLRGLNRPTRYVTLNDEWETFRISFSVLEPLSEQKHQVRVLYSTSRMHGGLGGDKQEVRLEKSEVYTPWCEEKYGKRVLNYEATVKINNPKREAINDPIRVFYQYQVQSGTSQATQQERG
jgi:hypothetical protein